MFHLSYMLHTEQASAKGFYYLWAKHVTAFNPEKHCAQCLVGKYEKRFGLKMPVNVDVDLSGYAVGDLLYFCGVSTPHRHVNNMHLAVRVTGDPYDTCFVKLYTGDILTVVGAVAVPFGPERAETDFPTLGKAFLTCRNFQFGAHLSGVLPRG